MSLFQCTKCGAKENTACCNYWMSKKHNTPPICSECETGTWHGLFAKKIYPIGILATNRVGNLQHKETGETDLTQYETTQ